MCILALNVVFVSAGCEMEMEMEMFRLTREVTSELRQKHIRVEGGNGYGNASVFQRRELVAQLTTKCCYRISKSSWPRTLTICINIVRQFCY